MKYDKIHKLWEKKSAKSLVIFSNLNMLQAAKYYNDKNNQQIYYYLFFII